MTTSDIEVPTNLSADAPDREPASTAALPKRRSTRGKSKPAKQTSPARKRAKTPKKAKRVAAPISRKGSKTAKVLDLLKRPGGATLKDLIKATGWQPHSVRGFLSGTIGKKMGLSVVSIKDEGGERTYSVKP